MSPEVLRPFALPSSPKIGWIGTGVMGSSMCGHFLSHGYPVTLFTRSRNKAESLVKEGAKEIAETAQSRGAFALDAPVSGGDVGARNASLSIMVGGAEEVVEAISPLLELMGKRIVYQGGPGSGQHTKMCNQIVGCATMIGMCESLLYGHQAGLNLETMLHSIRGGAAACWMLENVAPLILKRDFGPGFFVEHFVKDMGIALDEAKRMNLLLPGLALVHQLYLAVQDQGHGRLGTQALLLALERLSNTEIKASSLVPSSQRREG